MFVGLPFSDHRPPDFVRENSCASMFCPPTRDPEFIAKMGQRAGFQVRLPPHKSRAGAGSVEGGIKGIARPSSALLFFCFFFCSVGKPGRPRLLTKRALALLGRRPRIPLCRGYGYGSRWSRLCCLLLRRRQALFRASLPPRLYHLKVHTYQVFIEVPMMGVPIWLSGQVSGEYVAFFSAQV
jgi:hypothetical protein